MYIILDNDKIIRNIRKEADQYITTEVLQESDFTGGLNKVLIVDDDGNEMEETNLGLISLYTNDNGETQFSLYKISKEDLRYAQTRSDIEYIAMMADVDLGTEETL